MANLLNTYGMTLMRVTKASGQVTTVALRDDDYFRVCMAHPEKKARVAAANAASLEFDRMHPDAPRNRTLSRSSFVRRALLSS